jgi:hypothetical protein
MRFAARMRADWPSDWIAWIVWCFGFGDIIAMEEI